jgi:hypothetical protein
MFRHLTAAAGLALLLGATPVAAQQTVETYFMSLGPQDFVNSRGERLGSFGQAVQQDRANYHRFGRRDPADEGDRIFTDQQARAAIPGLVAAYPRNRDFEGMGPGRANFADYLVSVCATNGRLSHIVVDYADGDGHTGC